MLADIPENRLTEAIIQSAIEVHRTLGPGLKEEVYEAALALELGWKGMETRRSLERGHFVRQETLSLPFIRACPEKCLVGVSMARMPSNKLTPKTLRVSVPPSLRVSRRRRFPDSLPPPVLKGEQ